MPWKKGVSLWNLEMERRDSSSPVLSRNCQDWEPGVKSDKQQYAELEFRTLASLVRQDRESTKEEPSMDKLIYLKTKKSAQISFHCCLNVGNVLLIAILLTTSISFLSLYLQVSRQQRDVKREAEELRINQSRCQEDLGDQQNMNINLQSNVTFLIQDSKSRQELALSQLQQAQEKHVQNTQRMEQNYQQLYKNYSRLQETYSHLWNSHVFLHRESAILNNCHRGNSSDEGEVCPFCLSDWQFFGVSCYKLSPSATNWLESASWCRMQGGHLVVVNHLEEQHFLKDLVNETSWIGLTDRDFEGSWRWVDGTPYVIPDKTSNLWILKQPDNMGNEDCVAISPGSGWSDEKCTKSYYGICEHRAFQLVVHKDMISN